MSGKKAGTKDTERKEAIIIKIVEIALPAVLSVVAIAISLFVANNQNRISLFEERYAIYQTCKTLNVNAQSANEVFLTQEIDSDAIETWIAFVAHIIPENSILDMAVFETGSTVSEEEALEVYLQISKDIGECCVKIESSKYVFKLSEAEEREIDTILQEFKAITYEGLVSDPNGLGERMIQLTQALANLSVIETMEDQLKLW